MNTIGQAFVVGKECPDPTSPHDISPRHVVSIREVGKTCFEVRREDGMVIRLMPGMQAVFRPDRSALPLDDEERQTLTNMLYVQGRGQALSVDRNQARDDLVQRASEHGQIEAIQAVAAELIEKRKVQEAMAMSGETDSGPEMVYRDEQGNALDDGQVEGPPEEFLRKESENAARVRALAETAAKKSE